jgi:hypothetical protein
MLAVHKLLTGGGYSGYKANIHGEKQNLLI